MRQSSTKRYGRARSKQHATGQAVALNPEKQVTILRIQLENAIQSGLNIALYETKLDELFTQYPELQEN